MRIGYSCCMRVDEADLRGGQELVCGNVCIRASAG